MYQLVILTEVDRGTTYLIDPSGSELTVGRQLGNGIVVNSPRASKRHCVFSMQRHGVIVKDLGSSNGTFVNGVLVRQKLLKAGDRISVGECVFELVETHSDVSNATPSMEPAIPSAVENPLTSPGPPKDLKAKLIWLFDQKIMPFFYSLNLKHEWHMIYIGIVAAFVIGNLLISVQPLLDTGREAVIREVGVRARLMAKDIADRNSPLLAARAETKTDLGRMENAEGVRVAVLTDLDNRILAPGSRMNTYFTTGSEAAFAVKARDQFKNGRETGFVKEIDSSTLIAIEPVKVLSPTAGKNVVVGMAIVSVDTTLSTPDLGEIGVAYSETLILTGLLGGILFFILYRLTLKPFQVLGEDMDQALKGTIPQVTHEYKLEELNSLWDLINSALQRIPKVESAEGGFAAVGDSASSIEDYVEPLKKLAETLHFGLVVFNADRKIHYLNPIFEEASGIRSESALGHDISEVARDQALGALSQELLSRVMPAGEAVTEEFDFSGVTYRITVGAFGSAGSAAKCYFMAASKAEG